MTDIVTPGKYNVVVKVEHILDPFNTTISMCGFTTLIKEECTYNDLSTHIKTMILQRKIMLSGISVGNIKNIVMDSYGKVINGDE